METEFGTEHLAQQESVLGDILKSPKELVKGQDYLIVDLGLAEWNGGYRYLGMDYQEKNFIFKYLLNSPSDEPEYWVFSKAEMDEMIRDREIAHEDNVC